MFSAIELLSVNHPNSLEVFVLLLCKDSRCLGIHGYLFEKHLCSLESKVLPSKVPRQRLGLEHKPSACHCIQNLDPSSSWRCSPSEATVTHCAEGVRGTHGPGKRRHIFKCHRQQERGCQAGLPPFPLSGAALRRGVRGDEMTENSPVPWLQ